MPTPINILLQGSNEDVQLSSSQNWNWKTGEFNGFIDRDIYLQNVCKQFLIKYKYPLKNYYSFNIALPNEKKHRELSLSNLQQLLQSRKLKRKVSFYQNKTQPIRLLSFRTSRESILLDSSCNSPLQRAAFSINSIRKQLIADFELSNSHDIENIFSINLSSIAHIYPTPELKKYSNESEESNASAIYNDSTEEHPNRNIFSQLFNWNHNRSTNEAPRRLTYQSRSSMSTRASNTDLNEIGRSYFPTYNVETNECMMWQMLYNSDEYTEKKKAKKFSIEY